MTTFKETVKEKLGVVIATTLISILTIFSDKILASIKSSVNKAEQRPVEQKLIAKDISGLVFTAENVLEFTSRDLTSKEQLHFVVDPYNDAIDGMRKTGVRLSGLDKAILWRSRGRPVPGVL